MNRKPSKPVSSTPPTSSPPTSEPDPETLRCFYAVVDAIVKPTLAARIGFAQELMRSFQMRHGMAVGLNAAVAYHATAVLRMDPSVQLRVVKTGPTDLVPRIEQRILELCRQHLAFESQLAESSG